MQLITKRLDSTIQDPKEICELMGLSQDPVRRFEWHFILTDEEVSELLYDLVKSCDIPLPTTIVMAAICAPPSGNPGSQEVHNHLVFALTKQKPILAALIAEKLRIDANNERKV